MKKIKQFIIRVVLTNHSTLITCWHDSCFFIDDDDDDDDLFGGDRGDDTFMCLETLEPLAGIAVQTNYKCNGKFVSAVIHVGSAADKGVGGN